MCLSSLILRRSYSRRADAPSTPTTTSGSSTVTGSGATGAAALTGTGATGASSVQPAQVTFLAALSYTAMTTSRDLDAATAANSRVSQLHALRGSGGGIVHQFRLSDGWNTKSVLWSRPEGEPTASPSLVLRLHLTDVAATPPQKH